MDNKATTTRSGKRSLADYGWGKILVGIIFGGAVIYLHNLFTDLETGAIQSARLNVIFIFLYKTLGHIPTLVVIGLLGAVFVIWGIRQLINERNG